MILFFIASYFIRPDETIISYLFGSLFFAILFATSMRSLEKKMRANLLDKDIYMNDKIISKGLMNCQKGIMSEGGAGYLLTDRFVFHPHKLNFSTKDRIFLLSEIERIQPYKVIPLFSSGLKIVLKSGKEEKFVLDRNDALYKKLLVSIN
jgi:hypothetical protein